MYICSISLMSDTVNFITHSVEAFNCIVMQKTFFNIDNFSVKEYSKKCPYCVIYEDSQDSELIISDRKIFRYRENWSRIVNTTSLKSVIYQVIDFIRQENNRYMLHASAISHNGNGLVLIGNSGAGKTSLALAACKKLGCKLISNDRVVVGEDCLGFYIDIGSKLINLRIKSITTYLPELIYIFNTEPISKQEKVLLSVEQLNIPFETNKVRLQKIISINLISNWKGRPIYKEISTGENVWRQVTNVNSVFSQIIRGCEQSAYSNEGVLLENFYMPNLDTQYTSRNRLRYVNRLIKQNRFVELASDMEFALSKISSILFTN